MSELLESSPTSPTAVLSASATHNTHENTFLLFYSLPLPLPPQCLQPLALQLPPHRVILLSVSRCGCTCINGGGIAKESGGDHEIDAAENGEGQVCLDKVSHTSKPAEEEDPHTYIHHAKASL